MNPIDDDSANDNTHNAGVGGDSSKTVDSRSSPLNHPSTQAHHSVVPNSTAPLAMRIAHLLVEHRDLDLAIEALIHAPAVDELAIKRMKRRKLLLKDQITWLQRENSPDEHA